MKLLNETHFNNLLVCSCKIYLEKDFLLVGLKALEIFIYNVTMPFLYCVGTADQEIL